MLEWLDTSIKLPALEPSKHQSPAEGLCAMEMVAFMERLPHTDKPACTCPVLAEYVRNVNDLAGPERQRLLPYLPRLVGTVAQRAELRRARGLARAAGLDWRVADVDGRIWIGAPGDRLYPVLAISHRSVAEGAARLVANLVCASGRRRPNFMDIALRALEAALAIGPQGRFTYPERALELAKLKQTGERSVGEFCL